jgi:flagellar basal-body rod protein FlgG
MFDAIMRVAAANANKQTESLDRISTNVANYNTTGYKAKRFEQYLTSDSRMDGLSRVDTSRGDLMKTQRELDIAIDGAGYIPVTQPDGTVAYTRDGSFSLNSQGYIVTNRGDLVGEGIKVPADYKQFEFKQDGSVLVKTTSDPNFKPIGKISLVRFASPEKLTNIGYNKLQVSADSGAPLPETDSQVKQGFLERSNVNIYGQIEQVLRLNASLISNIRIIKFADDLYRQSVNLRQ